MVTTTIIDAADGNFTEILKKKGLVFSRNIWFNFHRLVNLPTPTDMTKPYRQNQELFEKYMQESISK